MIREFTLTNALGQTYSLMNTDDGAIFQPKGLGYEDVTQYEQVGEFFAPLTERFGQQVISGQMVFGVKPYVKYLNFTKFCRHAPLSFVYETDAGTFQIPVRMTKIEKGDTDGWTYLQCPVEFTALARMYKTVVANNTGSAGGGKEYFEKSCPDVSGSIVTIMDNTSTQTTFNLSADINAVQDLHGYDKPWVGGAGKNLIKVSADTLDNSQYSTSTVTDSGVTITATGNYARRMDVFTVEIGVTYTLSFKGKSSGDFNRVYVQKANTWNNADNVQIITLSSSVESKSYTFTATTSTLALGWYVTANSSSGEMVITDLQLEKGSQATIYAPYENICPISGHDDVGISVTGVNVWDEEWLNGYLGNSGNFISDANSVCSKNYIPIKQSATYYGVVPSGKSLRICAYKADKTFISRQSVANQTFTLPSGTAYIKWSCYSYGATYANDISINYPSTDHDYHAYNGQTYTTTLPSTTYGGTLDLVSGELTVTHGNIASYNGETLPSTWISDRDVYASGTTPTTGAQVVYQLATPTTTTLTPQQIELLIGTNNIWADSGDVYLSNLKTYGYIYDYVYGDFVADTVAIDSDSVTASPCRISIFGPCTQPTWRHYVDGVQVATGYYNGTIPQNHKLVIDTTSSPYSIQEEDIAGNLIADRYELCDFSTERFFLLEYGRNTISVGHGDVDSIRLMVEGYIFYETV